MVILKKGQSNTCINQNSVLIAYGSDTAGWEIYT